MLDLVVCPSCRRHVKRADTACPFCHRPSHARLFAGATFAGIAVAMASCAYGPATPPSDGGGGTTSTSTSLGGGGAASTTSSASGSASK